MAVRNLNVATEMTDGAGTGRVISPVKTPVTPTQQQTELDRLAHLSTPTPVAAKVPTPTPAPPPAPTAPKVVAQPTNVPPPVPPAPKAPITAPSATASSGYSLAPRPDNIGAVPVVKPVAPTTTAVKPPVTATPVPPKPVATAPKPTPTAPTTTVKTPTTPAQDTRLADYQAEIAKIAQEQEAFEAAQKESLDKVMEMVNTPNQHLEELKTMTFEYDPQSDPEYLRNAAGLENQIAQTMVGRGGLYSSVASSALNASLINLQMNMTSQKHKEFIDNRNFTFQLAQSEQSRKMDSFNQMMSIRDASAKDRSAALDEYLTLAKFEADTNQRAFENALAQEQWRVEQEQIKFENAVTTQELQLRKENAIADAMRSGYEQQIANSSEKLMSDFALYQDLATDYASITKMWQTSNGQMANVEVVRFFEKLGIKIRPNASFVETSRERQMAKTMLYEFEQKLRGSAIELNMNAELLEQLRKMSSTTSAINPTMEQFQKSEVDRLGSMSKPTTGGSTSGNLLK